MLKTVSSATHASRDDQVAAEQVRGLYRSAPVGVVSALFGVGILCWVLIHTDPSARRLTNQIGESLRAMDGLFNALLDISSLDAGVTRRSDKVFRVGPLLERIGREFALQ